MSVVAGPDSNDAATVGEDRPTTQESSNSTWWRISWRLVVFVGKFSVGVVLCQSFLGSLLVVGWTFRLMRRSALKAWWKGSDFRRDYRSFREFSADSETLGEFARWPNWLLGYQPATLRRSAVGRLLFAASGALWTNARAGLQAVLATSVVTLPGCILWLFAWYAGWNNSFHKGYEQAQIGPLTGILGIVLFIVAMLYVPLAQARQAVTDSFAAFFDFRFVWRLIRMSWPACLVLAVLYSLLAIPTNVFRIAPAFFPQGNPALEEASDEQLLLILRIYYLVSSIFVFAAFVFLKCRAARIYARAILAAIRKRRIDVADLHPAERRWLLELRLLDPPERRTRHVLLRAAAGTSRWARNITLGVATSVVWLSFVVQIFTAEFFHYHPVEIQGNFLGGWLNQPLVQVPWFNYTPSALKERVRTGVDPGLSADWDAVID